MKKHIYIKVILWMLVCPMLFIFILEDKTLAQSSVNYQIRSSVFDQGGASLQSSNHMVSDAMGQPSPIGISTSSNYIVISGFLSGIGGSSSTSIGPELPAFNNEFFLFQNYPNPFRNMTRIRFSIPEAGHVKLEVYTLLGKHVATLMDAYKTPGYYMVNFDAAKLSAGVFLYKLQAEQFQAIKKMTKIR